MDLVARAIGEGCQEEGCLDGGIQAGCTAQGDRVHVHVFGCAEQSGGGASTIHDDEDVSVSFGAPLAHYEFGGASGCAPVDVSRVVTFDVGAQGVKLGARAAQCRRRRALQFVEPSQARG